MLIERVLDALAPQVEAVVVCGRDWPAHSSLADRPGPGLGPLGGLCAALLDAERRGFDAVLCAPCDALDLPADLATRLMPGPSVAAGQRAVGLWPAALAPVLSAHLAVATDRSIRAWLALTAAREVDCGALHNVNHPGDLPGA